MSRNEKHSARVDQIARLNSGNSARFDRTVRYLGR
jgi:hypothetical protein